jgi:hypothetical protein
MCQILTTSNVGTNYGHATIPALMLIDYITLVADCAVEIQRMLDIIHNQAMKYHVRFVEDKCKVMFGWQLGTTKRLVCTSYMYLGETITSDCTKTP